MQGNVRQARHSKLSRSSPDFLEARDGDGEYDTAAAAEVIAKISAELRPELCRYQVVTVCAKGERVLRGGEMGSVAVMEREEGKGRGVGVVVDEGGKIAAVGFDSEIDAAMAGGRGGGGVQP